MQLIVSLIHTLIGYTCGTMNTVDYGIYTRSDDIKVAYIIYQTYNNGEPWDIRLFCAECPASFITKYDPTREAHRKQLIRIARHKGCKGGYSICDSKEEAYVCLEVYNPATTEFWI